YQGAEIVRFNQRLWLGYEWQFGAAFGWKYEPDPSAESFKPVSTFVTAPMGLSLKLHYCLSERWQLSAGLNASHFSNGNTSIPNTGVNSIGASVGVCYTINPVSTSRALYADLDDTAGDRLWHFDITAFGAWRKRIVSLGSPPEYELCPGKFGVLGLQISPLRTLNRWVAVGPSIDLKWDESACLQPYWVEGSHDDEMKFVRPPLTKQISAGLSAHAELTMPIFSVNAGIGYDLLCPKGDVRFYQSLALKAFVTKTVFLNIGYRLGNFSVPQNLMLGVGVRL
ncbi:MAG: acyloxyacyl hydrolase, partial [Muribaculaceae bacterium]|nr:acyloxyacyl hydrolase [Muribaculaceae bacterium]